MAALTLAQVLACSDLPAGVVNIVTGPRDDLGRALAGHDGVSAGWHAGQGAEGLAELQRAAAETLIPVWCPARQDWTAPEAQGREFMRRASRAKTIWLPYGALPAGTGSAAY